MVSDLINNNVDKEVTVEEHEYVIDNKKARVTSIYDNKSNKSISDVFISLIKRNK